MLRKVHRGAIAFQSCLAEAATKDHADGTRRGRPYISRLEAALGATAATDLPAETERFLQVLKAVGTPMVEGAEVSFVAYEPSAEKVLLVGEFNDWGKSNPPIAMAPINGSGIFYHVLTLAEPARLEYKFVVNGEWKTDPFCPNRVDNGVGGQNSFFETGDFHEPPELQYAAEIPHGRVEQFAFASDRLKNERQVHVYLPAAYDEDRDGRFPSFYVHDGGEYLERARMAIVLDNLIHAREIPPLIAVMIDPVNRMHEYWANDEYAGFLCSEFRAGNRSPLPHPGGSQKPGGHGRLAWRLDLGMRRA